MRKWTIKEVKEVLNLPINESAPKIPSGNTAKEYWSEKGKDSLDVALYFHDDLDGVLSAVLMKKELIKRGYSIRKYGVVEYRSSWRDIDIDERLINVAVDFAVPNEKIDIYIDHHGAPTTGERSSEYVGRGGEKLGYELSGGKLATKSGFQAILQYLGLPQDKILVDVVNMIDSAGYEKYGVPLTQILSIDIKDMAPKDKNDTKGYLRFGTIVNQLIKRSDQATLVEMVHRMTEPSIFQLYNNIKFFNPQRIEKTKTKMDKFTTQYSENIDFHGKVVDFRGIVVSNGVRAAAKLEDVGITKDEIYYILLQFGNTLQVAKYNQDVGVNLGEFMKKLRDNTASKFRNKYIKKRIAGIEGGGHDGIGSLSNIPGFVFKTELEYLPTHKQKTPIYRKGEVVGEGYKLTHMLADKIIRALKNG